MGGLAAAAALRRVGIDVTVYEQATQLTLKAQQLADDPWLHPANVVHDLPAQIVLLRLELLSGGALAAGGCNSECFEREYLV